MSFGRFAVGAFLDAPRDRRVLILLTPLNKTGTEKERSQANLRWRRSRALLGLGGTLGFRSMSLALMAATWAVYHLVPSIAFIFSLLSTFLLLVSSFVRCSASLFLSLSLLLSPPLFFSTLFIYSFGPAAALCPLARRPVGCPLVVGRCSFEYFCSRNSNVRRRPVQASIQ